MCWSSTSVRSAKAFVQKYQLPNIDMLTSVGKWTSMGVYEGQYPIVRMLTVSSMLLGSLWFCMYWAWISLLLQLCTNCKHGINILKCYRYELWNVSTCTGPASTCLNWIIMSFDSSMSLNIPSSLLVNAAPHSGVSQNHNVSHFFHTSTYFNALSAMMQDRCQYLLYIVLPKGRSRRNLKS